MSLPHPSTFITLPQFNSGRLTLQVSLLHFWEAHKSRDTSEISCGVLWELTVPAGLPKSVVTSSLIGAQAEVNVSRD